MSAKLPFEASKGQVQVTQLEHVSVEGVLYPPQLYYSYDFGLADGDSVLSIADGVVVSLVNNVPEGTSLAPINHGSDAITYPQLGPGGFGNQVTIYYDALGLYVTYAHLKTDSIPFSQSDIDAGTATVSQGQQIGVVGLTGTGTGPHLHITYGTTLTGWGGSTSGVYPTTTIADGSIATNPNDFKILFDEAGGQSLSLSSYQSQNIYNSSDVEATIALSEQFLANTLQDFQQIYPTITSLDDGNYVVLWETSFRDFDPNTVDGGLKFQLFSENGESIGEELLVDSDVDGRHSNVKAVGLSNGDFVVTWLQRNSDENGTRYEIRAKTFDAVGNTVGTEIEIPQGNVGDYTPAQEVISLEGGGFLVSWMEQDVPGNFSSWSTNAQVYDGSGLASGPVIEIGNDDSTVYPDVTQLADGRLLFVWENEQTREIKGQVVESSSGVSSEIFLINDAPTSPFAFPEVVSLKDGGFAVIWTGEDDNFLGVRKQVFDRSGAKVGSEEVVNSVEIGSQFDHSVSANSNGGFTVVWTSRQFGEGDNVAEVFGRVFSESGLPLTDEFQVSTVTPLGQNNPSVTALGDSGILVAWHDFDDVFVRRLDVSPSSGSVGSNPIVNGETDAVFDNLDAIPFSTLFSLSDPDGLDDIVEVRISDDTAGSDSGELGQFVFTFQGSTAGNFWIPQQRIEGEPYRLTLSPDQLDDQTGGPFPVPVWNYRPSNEGSNAIQIEAVDSAGNVSDPLIINLTFEDTGSGNQAPSLNITELEALSLAVDENTAFIFDLEPSDPDGDDLTYSISGSSADLIDVDQATGVLSFKDAPDFENPFSSVATSPLGVGVGYEFSVTVTDSGGLSDAADFFVRVTNVDDEPEPLERANTLELEYFARQSAYGYGPYLAELGDAVNASQSASEIEEFLDGWQVGGEFPPPGASSTFRAIILEKPGYYPVVAFRGTQTTLQDWAENFRNSGVGEDEFRANVFSSGLRDWIDTNPIFSVTGHSQGGAQAQLFAILAGLPEVGATVQNLTTFNSAGIPTLSSGGSTRLPEQVDHFVNASDVVSLVGDTFLDGTLHYSDFTDNELNPLKVGLTAHTGYWMQEQLGNFDFYQNEIEFISASELPVSSPVSTPPSLEQFIDPDFDPLGNYGQDSELSSLVWSLVGVLTAYEFSEGEFILGLPRADLSSVLSGIDAGQLRNDLVVHHQSRSGWEYLREKWGPEVSSRIDRLPDILERFEVATDAFGQLGRDTVEFWLATGEFSIDVGVSLGNAVLSGTALAGRSVVGLGNFVIDSTQGAIVQTFLSASEVAEWIGVRFQPDAPLPFVGGTHNESTPAVAGNFNQNTDETLSSSAPGSIFIVTDPNSTIQMETGDNLIWGVATDYDGLVIEGGVGNTDLLFIQDEFFDTNDLNIFRGSAVIEVDLDQDGSSDITVSWEGDYRLESIVAEQAEDGTYIRYLGNALPEATDDEFATSESTSFTTDDVLLNDTDGDGDVLSVTGLDLTGTLGSVVDNGDGTFDYDPNGAFDDLLDGETASDTFAYFVSDGVETVRGEVTVTISGESQPEPVTTETVDIDFIKQGFFGCTTAEITLTGADGNAQTDIQAIGWLSRKISLDEADIKITSGGPGYDTVSAIHGGLGVSSRADGFSFRDRLDIDRKENLKFSLLEDDEIATRLLLDFAEQEGDVQLIFFNDGERVSRDTYSYEDGMLELTDLAFDKVQISGSGRDDVRVTGIEFDRVEESDFWVNGSDSFNFV